MELRSELGLGEAACFVAILADHDRTCSFRAMSKGSSPNSRGNPAGSTRRTPLDLRPYPRERTSNLIPRAFSNSPSSMTKGVFPDPPVERLPTLTTAPCRRTWRNHPLSQSALRAPTPPPHIPQTRFNPCPHPPLPP